MNRPLTQGERRKQEAAEKMQVIEAGIEMRLEALGDDLTTRLWAERKAGVTTLTLEELRQLGPGSTDRPGVSLYSNCNRRKRLG